MKPGGRGGAPVFPGNAGDYYRVLIDDNFHYMDEEERCHGGDFDTLEEAIVYCRKIVDDYLARAFKPDMSAEALYSSYTSFGEDPFIAGHDPRTTFSAWDYAKARCAELCAPRQ